MSAGLLLQMKLLLFFSFFSDSIKYTLNVTHEQTSTGPASNITITILLPHYVTFKMAEEAASVEVSSRYDEETNSVEIKVKPINITA